MKMDKRCEVLDVERVLRDIQSDDEDVRARAVRSLCPCRSGWGPFEQHLHLISALRKDPSPLVRKEALHLFEDAGEMESEALPTHPSQATNEMVQTRRASRFRRDESNEGARKPRGPRGRRSPSSLRSHPEGLGGRP
jgi:hypothetical protein